jgi:hypothetical protein
MVRSAFFSLIRSETFDFYFLFSAKTVQTNFSCRNWIFWNLLQLLHQYPSGITRPIVLNELQLLWDETAADWRRALQRSSFRFVCTLPSEINADCLQKPSQSILFTKIE